MKLKAIYLLAIFVLLAACAPQVTVTSEVTASLPPPTETLVPTPTGHPQFLEWQESIAALSERFALMPDGSIQDNGVPIPGVRVSPDGVMTLTLADGTEMTLDSSDVSFDDEKGFGAEGYTLNYTGEWGEAESAAMQKANELVETYKLGDKVTVTEKGGQVNVVDNTTRRVLIKTNGERIIYDLVFGVDTVAANSCEPTPFLPSPSIGLMLAQPGPSFTNSYLPKLKKELNFISELDAEGSPGMPLLIDRKNQCWGYLSNHRLIYRDAEGVAQELALIPRPIEEVKAFRLSR
jgi:hypothetical protein